MATQSAAESARSKLNQNKTQKNQIGEQLVYPIDFLTRTDHPGLCVMFELNKLNYGKDRSYASSLAKTPSQLKSKNSSGVENTEVAMQRKGDAGAPTSVRSSIPGYKKTGMSIVLPPPDQWIENLNIAWDTTEFGALARDVEMLKSIKDGDFKAAGMQGAAQAPSMLAAIASDKTGGKLAKLADGAKKYVQLMAGIQQNEFPEMLFKSVNNRMFPFTFNFSCRNEKEAQAIHAIIHRFRWAAIPELWATGSTNAAFFRAPYTFDISFASTKTGNQSKYWTKFQTCALVNVSVNRTPYGEFSVIRDSNGDVIPQSVSVELQFTELTRLTKEGSEDPNNAY